MKTLTPAQKLEMTAILNKAIGSDHGYYAQSLFDPQQTHAIYGLRVDKVESMKQSLKESGCKKFRIVKNSGHPILCFDATNFKKS